MTPDYKITQHGSIKMHETHDHQHSKWRTLLVCRILHAVLAYPKTCIARIPRPAQKTKPHGIQNMKKIRNQIRWSDSISINSDKIAFRRISVNNPLRCLRNLTDKGVQNLTRIRIWTLQVSRLELNSDPQPHLPDDTLHTLSIGLRKIKAPGGGEFQAIR